MTDLPAASPWGEVTFRPGELRALEFGTLRLILRRTATEVWVQTQRLPDVSDPAEGEWSRWAASADSLLELRPAVPDRLLIVSHEYRYHLPPNGEARLYVRIPLFVQVVLTGMADDLVVADVPSVVLSDTWWGSFTEGELAYWLTTKARVAVTDDLFLPHVGMCPFRMINESSETLPLDRFAVRVPHLSLFSDGKKNWTDEVSVRYEDSPEGSAIRFGNQPPVEAGRTQLITHPRLAPERGFHARTFDRLRSLSSIGL